jgi:hypothetical protein
MQPAAPPFPEIGDVLLPDHCAAEFPSHNLVLAP